MLGGSQNPRGRKSRLWREYISGLFEVKPENCPLVYISSKRSTSSSNSRIFTESEWKRTCWSSTVWLKLTLRSVRRRKKNLSASLSALYVDTSLFYIITFWHFEFTGLDCVFFFSFLAQEKRRSERAEQMKIRAERERERLLKAAVRILGQITFTQHFN